GEFFLVDEIANMGKPSDKYCIIDYSTIINNNFRQEYLLKPGLGASFVQENQETLVEQYINDYLLLKNNNSKNRY
ncbi:MAG: hypothetical protein DRJ10_11440, partial [Bacteroidetes bacterium]